MEKRILLPAGRIFGQRKRCVWGRLGKEIFWEVIVELGGEVRNGERREGGGVVFAGFQRDFGGEIF